MRLGQALWAWVAWGAALACQPTAGVPIALSAPSTSIYEQCRVRLAEQNALRAGELSFWLEPLAELSNPLSVNAPVGTGAGMKLLLADSTTTEWPRVCGQDPRAVTCEALIREKAIVCTPAFSALLDRSLPRSTPEARHLRPEELGKMYLPLSILGHELGHLDKASGGSPHSAGYASAGERRPWWDASCAAVDASRSQEEVVADSFGRKRACNVLRERVSESGLAEWLAYAQSSESAANQLASDLLASFEKLSGMLVTSDVCRSQASYPSMYSRVWSSAFEATACFGLPEDAALRAGYVTMEDWFRKHQRSALSAAPGAELAESITARAHGSDSNRYFVLVEQERSTRAWIVSIAEGRPQYRELSLPYGFSVVVDVVTAGDGWHLALQGVTGQWLGHVACREASCFLQPIQLIARNIELSFTSDGGVIETKVLAAGGASYAYYPNVDGLGDRRRSLTRGELPGPSIGPWWNDGLNVSCDCYTETSTNRCRVTDGRTSQHWDLETNCDDPFAAAVAWDDRLVLRHQLSENPLVCPRASKAVSMEECEQIDVQEVQQVLRSRLLPEISIVDSRVSDISTSVVGCDHHVFIGGSIVGVLRVVDPRNGREAIVPGSQPLRCKEAGDVLTTLVAGRIADVQLDWSARSPLLPQDND